MTNSRKRRTMLVLAATAAYWLAIFVGTHLPGHVVHPSGHWDKVYHCGAFFSLAVLFCSSLACFRRLGIRHYAGVLGAIACYGIVDELTQTLAVNRSADPLDWLADMSGATVGTLLFAAAARYLRLRNAQGATG